MNKGQYIRLDKGNEYIKWMFYIKQGGTAGILDPVPASKRGMGIFCFSTPKTPQFLQKRGKNYGKQTDSLQNLY